MKSLNEISKAVMKEQINRVITVKANLLSRIKNKNTHPTYMACIFIHNYDNPVICHSSEKMIFSAMQEGRE